MILSLVSGFCVLMAVNPYSTPEEKALWLAGAVFNGLYAIVSAIKDDSHG